MVDLADWNGLISERTDDFDALRVTVPAPVVSASFASPFRALANDNASYFVKCLDGCPLHARMSLAIEYVVAGAARLIGAPVGGTRLVP
ncbi:hypothetical protein GCM10009555_039880 [Acrocarpospora macrocephala]|uniref:Aminoglycoside phosphotransferase domain-containing protein n=1 Tax=Acrocarpospora macrocephala TaxID=150177 RepID=A0A5M3WV74_9ACTN|nr:hypothetical protein [Acrocarpospora macrocephala]GES10038.1 hypothetical protein Amac_036350 [Acrocarpospora macrocephala]